MRRWSILIATVGGTQVRLHATFLLLLAVFAWQAWAAGGAGAALMTLLFMSTIFFCVLLHEFGHVVAARYYGIKTPDIVLLPIGGVASLERMPRKPVEEMVVALAGPAVNVVIATIIYGVMQVAPAFELEFDVLRGDFLTLLAQWNLIMVLFNMIPAFPMDGGRVFRAALAMFIDYGRATRWATTIGQGIAIVGGMLALAIFQNPLLIIIAFFIFLAAGQEAAYVSDQEATRGLTVRDAMMTNFRSLSRGARLQDAVNMLLSGAQHDFPVVSAEGEYEGILTRTSLISALAEHGAFHHVDEVMDRDLQQLEPRHALTEAMDQLRLSKSPALPVIDPFSGKLTGLLTAENVGEMLMVRAALNHN